MWVRSLGWEDPLEGMATYSSILAWGVSKGNVCVPAQPCQTLCDPMDCSPPGSSVHGILQAGMLEWVTISYSRGSS